MCSHVVILIHSVDTSCDFNTLCGHKWWFQYILSIQIHDFNILCRGFVDRIHVCVHRNHDFVYRTYRNRDFVDRRRSATRFPCLPSMRVKIQFVPQPLAADVPAQAGQRRDGRTTVRRPASNREPQQRKKKNTEVPLRGLYLKIPTFDLHLWAFFKVRTLAPAVTCACSTRQASQIKATTPSSPLEGGILIISDRIYGNPNLCRRRWHFYTCTHAVWVITGNNGDRTRISRTDLTSVLCVVVRLLRQRFFIMLSSFH